MGERTSREDHEHKGPGVEDIVVGKRHDAVVCVGNKRAWVGGRFRALRDCRRQRRVSRVVCCSGWRRGGGQIIRAEAQSSATLGPAASSCSRDVLRLKEARVQPNVIAEPPSRSPHTATIHRRLSPNYRISVHARKVCRNSGWGANEWGRNAVHADNGFLEPVNP